MAVAGIIGATVAPPTAPRATTAKPTVQAPQTPRGSGPAAIVQFSPQALAASAGSPASATAPAAAPAAVSSANAPKVNTVKVTLKESNEQLPLLTKQAKHGDPIAKLLLKQIEKKQTASQSAPSTATAAAAAEEEEGPETENTPEESGAQATGKSSPSAHQESGESHSVAETADSGENSAAEQHT